MRSVIEDLPGTLCQLEWSLREVLGGYIPQPPSPQMVMEILSSMIVAQLSL